MTREQIIKAIERQFYHSNEFHLEHMKDNRYDLINKFTFTVRVLRGVNGDDFSDFSEDVAEEIYYNLIEELGYQRR